MRKTFSKFPRQGRCPNGKELMRGAEIPMSFAGGGPFLVRKDGKLIGGALVAIIDTLGTKYGFMSKLTPGKGVNKVTSSVSHVCRDTESCNYIDKVSLQRPFSLLTEFSEINSQQVNG